MLKASLMSLLIKLCWLTADSLEFTFTCVLYVLSIFDYISMFITGAQNWAVNSYVYSDSDWGIEICSMLNICS